MNASEMTFGCEFELTIPRAVGIQVGGYSSGIQVPGLPVGWVAKSDGSIRARGAYMGVEIVSPVLCGADGVQQVRAACEWFQRVGARVNRSTGFHVHVGWRHGPQETARLVNFAANHERAIFAATGTSARERGLYCRPISSDPGYRGRFDRSVAGSSAVAGRVNGLNRYHSINLQNLGRADRQTIECRAFPGTVNATKAIGYIFLVLGLAEKSLKATRTVKWEPKPTAETSPIKRGGEGQTALCRLFYTLGWIKGRTKATFGVIDCPAAPSVKSIKREFMRLARKYDGAPTRATRRTRQRAEPTTPPVAE